MHVSQQEAHLQIQIEQQAHLLVVANAQLLIEQQAHLPSDKHNC